MVKNLEQVDKAEYFDRNLSKDEKWKNMHLICMNTSRKTGDSM